MNRATETKSEMVNSDSELIDPRRGMRVVGQAKQPRRPRFTIAVADDVFAGSIEQPWKSDDLGPNPIQDDILSDRRGSTIVPAVGVVAAAALIGYLIGRRQV